MSLERVQKILARAGIAARRKAEEIITAGRVTINGRIALLGDKADLETESVKVDGKRIQPTRRHRYLLLNKPKGVMTTVSDPDGRPTVVELVPPEFRKALVPVGRLDFMTEGLLLLTDDGEFAQRLSHPRFGCKKTYAVKVTGSPAEPEVDQLRAGIVLDGRRTSPSRIARRRAPLGGREGEAGHTWWTVELFEGRTRQIREMFFRIGHSVQKLRRVAIGQLEDPLLPVGSWRELAAEEVAMLLAGSGPRERAVPTPRVPSASRERAAPSPRVRSHGPAAAAGERTRAERARDQQQGATSPSQDRRPLGRSEGRPYREPQRSPDRRSSAPVIRGRASRPNRVGAKAAIGSGGAGRPRRSPVPPRRVAPDSPMSAAPPSTKFRRQGPGGRRIEGQRERFDSTPAPENRERSKSGPRGVARDQRDFARPRPERTQRPARTERPERPERPERLQRPEREERPTRAARPTRPGRPERAGRPTHRPDTARPASPSRRPYTARADSPSRRPQTSPADSHSRRSETVRPDSRSARPETARRRPYSKDAPPRSSPTARSRPDRIERRPSGGAPASRPDRPASGPSDRRPTRQKREAPWRPGSPRKPTAGPRKRPNR